MTIIRNMPFSEYIAIEAMSASRLRALYKSPLHFKEPQVDTEPQKFGTLAHTALLEPHNLDKYVVMPETRMNGGKEVKFVRNGQAWEEFQAQYPNAAGFITAKEMADVKRLAASVHSNPSALAAMKGEYEVTLLWDDPLFGKAKARLDILGEGFAADIKTASEISPWGFYRACRRYGYHIQAAWYLRGMTFCNLGDNIFRFIAVEPKAPFDSAVYRCDDIFIAEGKYAIEGMATQLADCEETGIWYGAWPVEQILTWTEIDGKEMTFSDEEQGNE